MRGRSKVACNRLEQLVAGRLAKPVRASQVVRGLSTIFGVSTRPASAPTREATADAAAGQRKGRILLAEDNAVNQRVATRLLEKFGYRVDVVADGRRCRWCGCRARSRRS